MREHPLARSDALEDRSADDGMGELQWVLVAEQVGADERARRVQSGRRFEPGELGRKA